MRESESRVLGCAAVSDPDQAVPLWRLRRPSVCNGPRARGEWLGGVEWGGVGRRAAGTQGWVGGHAGGAVWRAVCGAGPSGCSSCEAIECIDGLEEAVPHPHAGVFPAKRFIRVSFDGFCPSLDWHPLPALAAHPPRVRSSESLWGLRSYPGHDAAPARSLGRCARTDER
jgi:hypothetical protein